MSGPRNQRFELLVFALALLPLCICGCNRRPNAQKTFDHARELLLRGDLSGALAEAQRGYDHSAGRRSRMGSGSSGSVEGEIFVDEGHGKEALSLLSAPIALSSLQNGEIAIKRQMLLGSSL